MTRTEFLTKLEQALAALPYEERRDALNYYEEYFDSAGQENEAQTIADLGSPEEVARSILESSAESVSDAAAEPNEAKAANPKKASSKKKKPSFISFNYKVLFVVVVALLVCKFGSNSKATLVPSPSSVSDSASSQPQTVVSTSVSSMDESASSLPTVDEPENHENRKSDSTTLTLPISNLEQELCLDIDYGSVTFLVDDTLSDAVFQFKGFKDEYLTHSTEADGKSSIAYKLPNNSILDHESEPELTISLPTDALNTLTVDLALGNLELGTMTVPTLSVDLAMGNLSAVDLTSCTLIADLSMGNLSAQSLIADHASFQLKMGNLSLDQLTCGDFDADLSLGNAYIGRFAGINTASISVSMGDVDLSFEGSPSDYDIHVNSMMGGFLNSNGSSLREDDPSSPRKLTLKFVTCDTFLNFLH